MPIFHILFLALAEWRLVTLSGFQGFDDHDWRETLSELRLMVASAGFGDWDVAAAAVLDEDGERGQNPRMRLFQYARLFASFLAARSELNLARMREELGEILRDENGRPVTGAIVVDEHRDRIDEILEGPPSDRLLEVVNAFANAVDGQGRYFDDVDN